MIEPTQLDIDLLHVLNGDGGAVLDFIMYWVSAKLVWVPLYILLLWGIYKKVGLRNLLWFLLAMIVVIVLADHTANLAKMTFPKLRPSHYEPLAGTIHTGVYGYIGGGYSTISSHASNSIAVAIFCASVLNRRWIWIALVAWALLVSYSRIYLGVHYPFDVTLGLIEGTLWSLLIAKMYSKYILKK